jgi:MoaA/NifB/PqqE/SkfB family radical SAM enzyme
VEQNPRIRHVELSNWGEIFLNPELKGIIAYAHRHGIRLTANNGVNFNVASAEVIEQLVRCRFDRLTIAIDGTSEETYAVYRHGGSLRRVIANIERLNDEKRRHASRYPKLVWQLIVFGHNEHDLPLARQMAAALGMRFFPKLHADHWDTDHSPVRDPDTVKAQSGLPAVSREEFRQRYQREYFVPCYQIWSSPQVTGTRSCSDAATTCGATSGTCSRPGSTRP